VGRRARRHEHLLRLRRRPSGHPPLTGTILPGITRDAILTIAREQGLTVSEERYSIEQWRADAESGALEEVFACGTAAVVAAVGEVKSTKGGFKIGGAVQGRATSRIKEALLGVQRGETPDTHGWLHKLDV
jgi:branched-chain amino acid aminotransferase